MGSTRTSAPATRTSTTAIPICSATRRDSASPMAFDRPRRLFNLLIVVGFATLPDVARDTVYAAEPESTSSAAQNPLGALPQLDVTKARILFFRPGSFVGMAADARIR